METDLLARVCAEIEQRLTELRPRLDEYERLLEAADTLASIEAAPPPADDLPTPEPEPAPVPRAPRAPRILPAMPSLRTQPGPSALPPLSTAPKSAPAPVEVPPAISEPVVEEFEPEPEPEHHPASPSEVRQAIVAALAHGSHTIGELVMVTAMSTAEIRTNLSQLARQRKVIRVKRQGDGKSAFALPASAAHIRPAPGDQPRGPPYIWLDGRTPTTAADAPGGARALLAVHARELPQRDDLCGAFCGALALRAGRRRAAASRRRRAPRPGRGGAGGGQRRLRGAGHRQPAARRSGAARLPAGAAVRRGCRRVGHDGRRRGGRDRAALRRALAALPYAGPWTARDAGRPVRRSRRASSAR